VNRQSAILPGAAAQPLPNLRLGRFRDRHWAPPFVAVSGQFCDRLRAESHDRRQPGSALEASPV